MSPSSTIKAQPAKTAQHRVRSSRSKSKKGNFVHAQKAEPEGMFALSAHDPEALGTVLMKAFSEAKDKAIVDSDSAKVER